MLSRFNSLAKSLSKSENPPTQHIIPSEPTTRLQTVDPGNDWPLTRQVSSMPPSAEPDSKIDEPHSDPSQQLPSIPSTAAPEQTETVNHDDETPTTEQILAEPETNDDDEPCSVSVIF